MPAVILHHPSQLVEAKIAPYRSAEGNRILARTVELESSGIKVTRVQVGEYKAWQRIIAFITFGRVNPQTEEQAQENRASREHFVKDLQQEFGERRAEYLLKRSQWQGKICSKPLSAREIKKVVDQADWWYGTIAAHNTRLLRFYVKSDSICLCSHNLSKSIYLSQRPIISKNGIEAVTPLTHDQEKLVTKIFIGEVNRDVRNSVRPLSIYRLEKLADYVIAAVRGGCRTVEEFDRLVAMQFGPQVARERERQYFSPARAQKMLNGFAQSAGQLSRESGETRSNLRDGLMTIVSAHNLLREHARFDVDKDRQRLAKTDVMLAQIDAMKASLGKMSCVSQPGRYLYKKLYAELKICRTELKQYQTWGREDLVDRTLAHLAVGENDVALSRQPLFSIDKLIAKLESWIDKVDSKEPLAERHILLDVAQRMSAADQHLTRLASSSGDEASSNVDEASSVGWPAHFSAESIQAYRREVGALAPKTDLGIALQMKLLEELRNYEALLRIPEDELRAILKPEERYASMQRRHALRNGPNGVAHLEQPDELAQDEASDRRELQPDSSGRTETYSDDEKAPELEDRDSNSVSDPAHRTHLHISNEVEHSASNQDDDDDDDLVLDGITPAGMSGVDHVPGPETNAVVEEPALDAILGALLSQSIVVETLPLDQIINVGVAQFDARMEMTVDPNDGLSAETSAALDKLAADLTSALHARADLKSKLHARDESSADDQESSADDQPFEQIEARTPIESRLEPPPIVPEQPLSKASEKSHSITPLSAVRSSTSRLTRRMSMPTPAGMRSYLPSEVTSELTQPLLSNDQTTTETAAIKGPQRKNTL